MITLRPMQATQADYLHMQRWFHEPELQQWVWCDEQGEPPVSVARIAEKYGPRAAHPTDVFPYFILKDGAPIGFIQYYLHSEEAIGLDMWIGVPDARSRGCGSEALQQMVDVIHRKHPSIRELFIDPDIRNARAVRCYEKAGFRREGQYTDEEGDICLLMKIHFDNEATT